MAIFDKPPDPEEYLGDMRSAPWIRPTAWVLFFIWWGSLFVLSSFSGKDLPTVVWEINDKLVHFVYFAIGATLLGLALVPSPPRCLGWIPWALFAAVAMVGILDEFYQLLNQGRTGGDWADIAANAAGSALGTLVATFFHRFKR